VPVGGTALSLLLELVRTPGQPVSAERLMAAVWGRRVVEANNLRVQVSALRSALGSADLIRTVPGKGYLFSGAVRHEGGAAEGGMRGTAPLFQTAFIGRVAELAALGGLLARHRLVSIVGQGGLGKTRLALRLAEDMAEGYRDGVCVVDLVPVSDSERLGDAVAGALGAGAANLSAEDAVVAALRVRRMLLVLDNAEHLRAAVGGLLAAVLAGCPGVSVLVTSRVAVGLEGECVFALAPMAVPEEGLGLTEALEFDAVRLLSARAQAVAPVQMDGASGSALVEICRRLDGVALAIEMAAVRLQVMSAPQLLALLRGGVGRLGPRADGSVGGRPTVRTMFDWSWELLGAGERRLLQEMALFAGSAPLDGLMAMAEADGRPGWVVLDQLAPLVRGALAVAQAGAAEPRYTMLETTRQYALGWLAGGEAGRMRRAHARHFVAVYARAEAEWPRVGDADWLGRYGGDADNLRAALDWAFSADGDAQIGVHLAALSYPLWWSLPTLPLRELRHWYDLAARHAREDMAPAVLGRLWLGHSWRDVVQGDTANLEAAERAVALFRAAGEPVGLGAALWRAGSASIRPETYAAAGARLAEGEAVLRGEGATKWLALCLIRRADIAYFLGDYEAAVGLYREALAMCQATQHWYGLMLGCGNMGDSLFALGRVDEAIAEIQVVADGLPAAHRLPLVSIAATYMVAADRYPAAWALVREVVAEAGAVGLVSVLGRALEVLALLAAEAGESEVAARLAGFVGRIYGTGRRRTGARAVVFARLETALGGDVPTGLAAEGARWTEAEAVAVALGLFQPEGKLLTHT